MGRGIDTEKVRVGLVFRHFIFERMYLFHQVILGNDLLFFEICNRTVMLPDQIRQGIRK